ncbi:hypothetical protein DV736_g5911, partial [Chaetothyriales sp. CBS 134916]
MEYARRAVEKKSYALMEMLLTHGWDINTQLGPDEPAAITMAFDDRRMIEWFLSHGADPNAECEFGLTPLSVAVEVAPFDIVQLLVDHGGSVKRGTPLHDAAASGNDPAVRYLLDQGANPLIRDTRGSLPSEVARNTQHETTAQLLESATSAATSAVTTNST